MTSELLLPGSWWIWRQVDLPAGRKINFIGALSRAGVDITKQVNMRPLPQCQLSRSGFSHYPVLSPKGQEGILLLDVQGTEMASLGASRVAEDLESN